MIAAAIRNDIRLQWRHGFYLAYLLVSGCYIFLLHFLPDAVREPAAVLITFSDPGVLGFFFIGGFILLERDQGIHDPLFVTPLTLRTYIWSKTLSLTLLSLLSSLIIHIAVFGLAASLLFYAAGVALTSIFFTLLGLGVALRTQTMNGFFLKGTLWSFLFLLPMAERAGLDFILFILMPSHASLNLLEMPFTGIRVSSLIYSILLLSIWCWGAYVWVVRTARSHLLSQIGGR
jgi:fluoroquinolone transport system permease protein